MTHTHILTCTHTHVHTCTFHTLMQAHMHLHTCMYTSKTLHLYYTVCLAHFAWCTCVKCSFNKACRCPGASKQIVVHVPLCLTLRMPSLITCCSLKPCYVRSNTCISRTVPIAPSPPALIRSSHSVTCSASSSRTWT